MYFVELPNIKDIIYHCGKPEYNNYIIVLLPTKLLKFANLFKTCKGEIKDGKFSFIQYTSWIESFIFVSELPENSYRMSYLSIGDYENGWDAFLLLVIEDKKLYSKLKLMI